MIDGFAESDAEEAARLAGEPRLYDPAWAGDRVQR